jgi:hypothetical protein
MDTVVCVCLPVCLMSLLSVSISKLKCGVCLSHNRITSILAVAGKWRCSAGTVSPQCLGHHQGTARAYFQSGCVKVSWHKHIYSVLTDPAHIKPSRQTHTKFHMPSCKERKLLRTLEPGSNKVTWRGPS